MVSQALDKQILQYSLMLLLPYCKNLFQIYKADTSSLLNCLFEANFLTTKVSFIVLQSRSDQTGTMPTLWVSTGGARRLHYMTYITEPFRFTAGVQSSAISTTFDAADHRILQMAGADPSQRPKSSTGPAMPSSLPNQFLSPASRRRGFL